MISCNTLILHIFIFIQRKTHEKQGAIDEQAFPLLAN